MKYVDLVVQTILIILGIVAVFTDRMGVLMVQMVLGPWQMISCSVSLIAKGPEFKHKRIHFILSCVYLVVFFASGVMTKGSQFSKELMFFLLILPPWSLAVYYYLSTIRVAFPRHRKTSSFLPHINF
jgi:hypothetical protein